MKIQGKRLLNEKTIYFDVDETLNTYVYDMMQPTAKVECYGYITTLGKHMPHIELMEKFARLGYEVIVWSQSGAEWAEAVCNAFEIDQFVTLYLTKPRYYCDDLPCQAWMGQRIYKDPVTGEEK